MGRWTGIVRRHPWRTAAVIVYLLGLVITWRIDAAVDTSRRPAMERLNARLGAEFIDLPAEGLPVSADTLRYQVVQLGDPDDPRPPVVLLHGSPGAGVGLHELARELSGDGRRSIWFDLPGFASQSGVPYTAVSASAGAALTLAILDRLGIERAHIVGWSNGGAIALLLADAHAERTASITLLASVGAQETEGSGSYFFEHAKYKLGYAALVWAGPFLPHLGVLGPPDERRAFLLNFDQTDQRPLAGIMQRLAVPALILHGRDDFLVADWAAQRHHELMARSELVMTRHDHFMPFLAPVQTGGHIAEFLARHDDPAAQPERRTLDLAPTPRPFADAGESFLAWLHGAPWWLLAPAVALVGHVAGHAGRAWVCVLVGATELDIAVAWLGLALGKGARTVRHGHGLKPGKWPGVLLDPLAQLALGFAAVQLAFRPGVRLMPEWLQWLGWALGVAGLALAFRALPAVWSTRGRQRLMASLSRLVHHEWWPTWAVYAPLAPLFAWWALKHRHPLAFTACNPGIGHGGGLAGESKSEIIGALLASGDPRVLYAEPIAHGPSPAERARTLMDRLEREPRLGGFPVMLKPDAGEQGRGVKRCATPEDALRFFEQTPGPAHAQRYHPGPCEVGVFYIRDPRNGSGLTGRVFSVTRKTFPVLTGDGRQTLERLILAHPRYRCQADVFFDRFAERLGEVLPAGSGLTLSPAGNHRQGCMFTDGGDLLTPELEAAVCAIADGFRGRGGGGLDYGRFDLRGASEPAIARGEFGVVEVNGVTSESTTIYDPRRSALFAWRTLARHWSIAYAIGARNRATGVRPLSAGEALALSRRHIRGRRSLGAAG
jgi:pimeloyl-ACP methyl ester carboxylesterase